MTGALDGLQVVEFCDELGQLAGKLLADMGADVIKIEPPGGSAARAVGPFVNDVRGPDRSLNFWYHNTNKRSVILDVESSEAARKTAAQLIARADIVIEDRAPGVMGGFGLGYPALSASNPGLIYCSITPFGQDGPWAQFRTTDLVSLAAGGPMTMNGYDPEDAPGAPPIRGHGDQGYNTACHFAVQGILAALLYRDGSGVGQYIDSSAHEALSCTVEVGMPYYLYQRRDVVRQTSRHAAAARTEPWLHPTKDGLYNLIFGVARDNATWKKLKEWFQSEGFGLQFDEARFDTPAARQPGRGSPEAAEVMDEVGRFIAAHTAEEVYRGGQAIGNAWGIVRSPEETLDDPHWHDRGFFVPVSGEGLDTPALMPGAPYLFSRSPWELRHPAPKLGEHTAEVLASL